MNRNRFLAPGLLAGLILLAVTFLSVSGAVYAAEQDEQTAFAFFVDEMGLSPAAACGIMGNISIESGFKADITGLGGAYGICQWMGVRRSNLISFCDRNGLSYKTLTGQLRFLESELKGTFPSVYKYLTSVPNTRQGAYDAGYHWCYDFEIPGDRHNASVSRGQVARDTFWPKYGETSLYLTTAETDKGFELTWTGFAGKSCTVLRSDRGAEKYSKIGTVKTGTYTDSTVSAGKKYDYMVCPASHADKRDVKSNIVTVYRRFYLTDPSCSVTLGAVTCVYNGRYRRPSVTIRFGSKTLKENTHFTVTCSNNRDAGTATMEITGKGYCTGTVTKHYTIRKAPRVITAGSFTLPVSNDIVNIPVSVTGEGAVACTSSVYAVAYARGVKIVAKKPGISYIRIKAAATKNYRAASKTIKLTVVPPAPVITLGKKALAKNGRINVGIFWRARSSRNGYVLKYWTGKVVRRVLITDPYKTSWLIRSLPKGYRWSFQICSYRIIGGKRCYGPWSRAWIITT